VAAPRALAMIGAICSPAICHSATDEEGVCAPGANICSAASIRGSRLVL